MNSSISDISFGLYVHIPFCLSKCPYCNFYSEILPEQATEFISALFHEIKMYAPLYNRFDSIYIGGGTPSLLTAFQICQILSEIRKNFFVSSESEITVEINPADINVEYLKELYRTGVNRLSVGVQSFDDQSLSFLGRRHTAQQARNAITSALASGFENISIDMIYGIPAQRTNSWLASLHEAVSYCPAHISCYQLSIEEDTPLGRRHAANEFQLPDEEEQRSLFLMTADNLRKAGYIHYEVSSFARNEALMAKHNSKYWNHMPYLGLGPSSHSYFNNKRWSNKSSISAYINDIKAKVFPIQFSETLTKDQMLFEALFLSLRTKKGVDLKYIKSVFDYDMLNENCDQVLLYEKEGLIYLEDGHLRPTPAGFAIADRLCLI